MTEQEKMAVVEVAKRITVTLDDDTHQILETWAEEEERTVPNLLAWLAKKSAKDHHEQQKAQEIAQVGSDRP